MDHFYIGFFWLTFWGGLLSYWGYKCWLRIKEREMDLRAMGRLPQTANRQSNVEFRRLSDEIARLRDTTTQYDMTVESEIKALRERVALLENKLRDAQRAAAPTDSGANSYISPQQQNLIRSDTAVPVQLR